MVDWKALRSNWSVKLAALLIGVVLWAHVKTDQRYEHVVPFPLAVSDASGRFVVANKIPDHVGVTVTGTGKELIFGSHRGRVVLRPRISRREAVTVDIGLQSVEGLDQDAGIELVDIESPRSVVLEFDYLETRELDVSHRVHFGLEPGYTIVGDIRVDPPTVRVGGPRRFVRQLTSVSTDSLTLAGVSENVEVSVPVHLDPDLNLTATPAEVTVSANVQVLLERRLRDLPIAVTRTRRGVVARAMPETATLDVIGGADVVGALGPSDITVELDYRQRFDHGLDDLPLLVRLPDDVRLVRIVPKTANLVIVRGRR